MLNPAPGDDHPNKLGCRLAVHGRGYAIRMSNPQQPELARSRKVPHQDQDAVAGAVEGQRVSGGDAPRGPVPPENQPGHHPAEEQDKPDLNAFAEKMGIAEPGTTATSERGANAEPSTPGPYAQNGQGAPAAAPSRAGSRVVPRIAVGAIVLAVVGLIVRRRRSKRS